MRILPLLALLLTAGPAFAQHDHAAAPPSAMREWTSLPLIEATLKGRQGAELAARNSTAREFLVVPPKGSSMPLDAPSGKASLKPEVGNYHLVSAVDACDTHVATASTAVYFANPGPAPTAILRQAQPGLTIAPEKLPREHGSYRAGETWNFRVALDGQALPGAKVRLETSNGTRTELAADANGRVAVTFPEDFPPREQRPPEQHGRPTQASFVVAAITQDGTQQHIGAFNYSYRPGAYDGMNLWAGAGFGFAGMVLAAPLVRRRAKGGAK